MEVELEGKCQPQGVQVAAFCLITVVAFCLTKHTARVSPRNSAYFVTTDRPVADLRKAFAQNQFKRRLRVYTHPKLLIVDEVGHLPLDDMGANVQFQLISTRYERGSIILASNKSYGEWGNVFGDSLVAAALLDRLLHHSTTVNIRGQSYRLREKRRAGVLASLKGGESAS